MLLVGIILAALFVIVLAINVVSNYNEIMAGAVMAIVPIIFLFLILQKYIMTGRSKAAMK